jgi:leader peptidase (prepilin peptidase)/N-methyltransferase
VLSLLTGLFGLLIGSFLNVVIWRVPRGESVVSPGSACPWCGHPVRGRDNIPVLSWLLLRGRCRDCGEPIARRYPAVELGTGVAFAAVTAWTGLAWELPALLYLTAVAIALTLIDLDVQRLPDAIVLPSIVVAAALLTLAAAMTGQWSDLRRAFLAAAVLFAAYFLMKVAYPPGMGFGDVKLAALLGLYLGWIGWGAVVIGSFAAFVLGGIFSIGLVLMRRAGRKSGVPFGPWMILGAAVGITVGESLWRAYLSTFIG